MKRFFESFMLAVVKGAVIAGVVVFIVFLFWLDKVRFVF